MSGIFCVESYWSDSITNKSSVQGMVQMLGETRDLETAHRVVQSKAELLKRLEQWSRPEHEALNVCYLAFHSMAGILWAGDEPVSLSDLASALEGSCAGRRLHLSGCSTGAVNESDLREFRRVTGAQWISLYTTDIDWIEGAALDLLVLDWLADSGFSPAEGRRQLSARCGDLAKHLGLTAVTRNGVAEISG